MAIQFNLQLKGLDEAINKVKEKANKVHDAQVLGINRVALFFRDNCVKNARAGHPEHPNVVSGTLSGSFQVEMDSGEPVKARVGTDAPYDPFVEFGHSQEPGRFVPAIGKRLVATKAPAYPFFRPAIVETFDSGDAQKIYSETIKEEMET